VSGPRFGGYWALLAASALLAGRTAGAAAIVLSSEHVVSPGVVRVDMWFEDASRSEELDGIQFDVELADSGPGSLAPEPAFRGSSTTRSDGSSELDSFPFDLAASVTDPAGANDVRSLHAANDLLDVDSLAARIAAYPICLDGPCDAQDSGLLRDRIYLGSFDMNYDGTPVYYTLPTNSIFVSVGLAPPDPPALLLELRQGQGPYNRAIEGLAPEPAGTLPTALALAGLAALRARPARVSRGTRTGGRRSRRRSGASPPRARPGSSG
jgi:hypothetical protein